jgi:2-polyprenyl-6-methoxyphenol hydroxylase-like FAD-dependent oxidoreductase
VKVAICGAGISGLALAHRMHAHGWDVVVLERAPTPREQGYMIDFFGPGFDAAEAMGLLPRLRERAHSDAGGAPTSWPRSWPPRRRSKRACSGTRRPGAPSSRTGKRSAAGRRDGSCRRRRARFCGAGPH